MELSLMRSQASKVVSVITLGQLVQLLLLLTCVMSFLQLGVVNVVAFAIL